MTVGPVKQARDVRVVGFLKSKLGKAVLCDLDRAAGLLHLLAQIFQVSDGQTGIVSDDDRSEPPQRTDWSEATSSRFSALSTASLHIEPGAMRPDRCQLLPSVAGVSG